MGVFLCPKSRLCWTHFGGAIADRYDPGLTFLGDFRLPWKNSERSILPSSILDFSALNLETFKPKIQLLHQRLDCTFSAISSFQKTTAKSTTHSYEEREREREKSKKKAPPIGEASDPWCSRLVNHRDKHVTCLTKHLFLRLVDELQSFVNVFFEDVIKRFNYFIIAQTTELV